VQKHKGLSRCSPGGHASILCRLRYIGNVIYVRSDIFRVSAGLRVVQRVDDLESVRDVPGATGRILDCPALPGSGRVRMPGMRVRPSRRSAPRGRRRESEPRVTIIAINGLAPRPVAANVSALPDRQEGIFWIAIESEADRL
jgi:hypothetical protein